MATVTVSYQALAKAVRSALQTATVQADDNSQALLVAAKQMLDGIGSGQLVVSAASAASPAPAAAAVPPRTTGRKVGAPPISRPVNTRGGTVFTPERGVQHG